MKKILRKMPFPCSMITLIAGILLGARVLDYKRTDRPDRNS